MGCLFEMFIWHTPFVHLKLTWRSHIFQGGLQKRMARNDWFADTTKSHVLANLKAFRCVSAFVLEDKQCWYTWRNTEQWRNISNQNFKWYIYIYMYFLKFHEKNANAQLVTRSLLLTRLNLSSCLARQSGESYWAMQVERVGLEACKGTRKAYRQHVVEIPVKISIYIYMQYIVSVYNIQVNMYILFV